MKRSGKPPPDILGQVTRRGAFRNLGSGILHVSEEALEAVEGSLGRVLLSFRRAVLGAPLTTYQEAQERLTKVKALAVLGSDNVSSSAYATEEIIRVLVLAGVGALSLTLPLSLALVGVLAVVVISYHQVIRAYPSGGGSYIVSRANLGTFPGLLAAASLMTDYVLTVAVSVAAGVAALTAVFPALFPYRVALSIAGIVLLTVGNLRGIRESGSFFAVPFYVYVVSVLAFLAYGFIRFLTGTIPPYSPPPDWAPQAVSGLGLVLIFRAFSSGAVALTGVETISNGVPSLEAPESRNARTTLTAMAFAFGTIFLGIGLLASHLGIVPDPSERETVVSQLVRLITGPGWFHLLIQVSTAVLLIMAANSPFSGFPRLNSILASDSFMPRQLAGRGERLAFSWGILLLAALACLFILMFRASVSALVPLYTVGVFLAFTLSQTGMVRHWLRVRGRGWRTVLALNAVGALVTGVIVVESITVKFMHGAWIIVVLVPLLVMMMRAIRSHYDRADWELRLRPGDLAPVTPKPQIVLVSVAALNKPFADALAYARNLAPNVTCVYITDTVEKAEAFQQQWDREVGDVPLVVVESPYRNFLGALLAYIDEIRESNPDTLMTVVIPEFVPRRWWHHLLYSQRALRLKMALLGRRNIVVVDIPYPLRQ